MKVGDRIRIIGVPPDLPDDDLGTKRLFGLCLGRVFPIAGFNGELLELDVGEVLSEPSYMHTICIEPEFVEAIES